MTRRTPRAANLVARPALRLLLTARVVSVAGTGLGRVALTLGLLSVPGLSAAKVSIIVALQALPQLVFVLWGGVLADRLPRRLLMVGAEFLAAAAWTVLAVAVLARWDSFAVYAIAAVIAGGASAMFLPAMSGIVPLLVPEDELQRVNARLRVGQNCAMLFGFAAAGSLAVAVGPGWALLINGVARSSPPAGPAPSCTGRSCSAPSRSAACSVPASPAGSGRRDRCSSPSR